MKEIYLSREKTTFVDNEDYENLIKLKWSATFDGKNWYAVNSKLKLRMHRVIMGVKKGEIIDHIDRNTLNNQKHNLRICTPSQNNSNRKSKKNSASQYLGVSVAIQRRNGKVYTYWMAQIVHDNKKHYLGQYKTDKEAAIAYNEAAIKYHGIEFSNLNTF